MSEKDLEALAHLEVDLQQTQVVRYVYVAAGLLLVYDHLLTMQREIELVWQSPWSVTKTLFLLIRYIPFISSFVVIINQAVHNVPPNVCLFTYEITGWTVLLNITAAEGIQAFRTWAVWNNDRWLGIFLGVSLLASLFPTGIMMNRYLKSLKFAPAPYPEFNGCFVTHAERILYINWSLLLIFEAVVLVLLVISSYKFYKGGYYTKLTTIIHKDGIIFYVYLLCLSIGNLIITAVSPLVFGSMISQLENVLYSLLTARIIFHIRSAAYVSLDSNPGYDMTQLSFAQSEEFVGMSNLV